MDGSQGHRCKVCVLAAQSAWMAWEVARCWQKHAQDKSNRWVWLLGITDECQMFRYSESSCLAQQPIADEEGETWNLAFQDGPPKSTVGHMFPV